MRESLTISLPLLFSATAASAHTGHLGELAGHDHWVAGAAIGTAIVIGAWAALKGRGKPDRSRSESTDDQPADGDPKDA